MAWLTPGVLVSISPYCLIFCADSLVSFTQRPELAAISETARAAAAPASKTAPSRGDPMSFDDSPSETSERSTSVGSPMTASPSPSLISSISLPIVAAPQHLGRLGQYGARSRQPRWASSG